MIELVCILSIFLLIREDRKEIIAVNSYLIFALVLLLGPLHVQQERPGPAPELQRDALVDPLHHLMVENQERIKYQSFYNSESVESSTAHRSPTATLRETKLRSYVQAAPNVAGL